MRICQIIEPTTGGSIRVALDLSRQLSMSGEDVTLLYSPLRADAGFYEKIKKETAFHFVSFPIRNYISAHDLIAVVKLVWFLWKTGPYDVIHSHSSKAGGIARLAGVFFPRMARVYSPHAFYTMSPYAPRFYARIEKFLSYVTDAVVAVSSYEKEHAVDEIGICKDKVAVVPNAVQPFDTGSRDVARQKMGVDPSAFVLGFVGRLVEQKNVRRLISAFAKAVSLKPNLRLVVLGDGSCEELMKNAILAENVKEKVTHLGNQDARSFYAGFDALVCSSDYEGFSLVFLEALFAGVPIVTTPVGGAAEAVVDGQTGFIAPDFLEETLASAIVRVASLDHAALTQMGKASLEHCKLFTLASVCENMRAIYKKCLQKRRS